VGLRRPGNPVPQSHVDGPHYGGPSMKGILLWAIGIPLPIILLLYLFGFMH
jgi:hypothetical protein